MEDEDNSGWQLTESDPGVFTELLKNLGVPLMVDEIYSLDSDVLADYDPISALVFLFKWVAGGDEKGLLEGAKYDEEFDGFFAHQTVQNACATLAVINALGNIPGIEMGQQLKDLLSFTQEMDPQTCGLSVTSSLFLREAHNSLSPPPSLSLAGLRPKSKETEDAYHFVVYLPIHGCLYELDGLKSWPVNHGVVQPNAEGWLATARDTIQKRIATYPAGSIHFNLQALHTDPLPGLERELEHHQSSNNTIMIPSITNRIAEEKAKRERWAFENSLRRHNHIGLAYGLLYALASVGALDEATTMAKDKLKLRRQKAAKEGMMEED